MRPFGCLVTILNTLDPFRKFDGKVDEVFLVGYSVSNKAFRVFYSRTRTVHETLHINFLENKLNVAGVQEQHALEKAGEDDVQQYVLFLVWSSGSTNPQNTDDNDAFEVKELEFKGRKPRSEVYVSLSSSAQIKKHDDKTKREAKGKSLVESLIGYRNFSVEFDDFSNNNINEINAIDSTVPAVGQISTNSTNTFSAAGPSNTDVSPTHGKSSYIDTSQLPDDLNMPELEDITYSDDEEDVGFKDPDYPDKVYKVVKALYGLHQAPRAWYETLANYLLENGFHRGTIDQTMFIKRQKGDILLVQIYVDDIIFGSTNKDLCKAFEKLMKDKFQMSSIGKLTFFLGLQVKQKQDRIFISHDKYIAEILRKFRFTDGKSASTPIDTKKYLLKDPDGEDVNVHTYISMIGSLMYLTSSRQDIMFAVCACAHFQVTPKASHLHAVKRIFRYLKELASPDQTVSGKDSSNPLMADNLPKIIWYSTHRVTLINIWLVQKQTALGQTATGKEISNPFMAESIDCLPNEEIFTELSRTGLVRNVDSSTKFYMYTRFLQLMIREQVVNVNDVPAAGVADEGVASVAVEDVPTAVDEPSIPSLTPPTQPPPPS
nr:putative ribonuclease H-like domain-containing protein [Tanacetum cinerariifolium]